jgi:hypothetical protein
MALNKILRNYWLYIQRHRAAIDVSSHFSINQNISNIFARLGLSGAVMAAPKIVAY